jgi:MSHA biogenesis protein MshQ
MQIAYRFSAAKHWHAFLLFALLLALSPLLFAQTVQTFNSSGSWTAPAGITSVVVEAWGAGGGGESASGKGGGGGGGGAYAYATYAVTPGTTYAVTVGTSLANADGGNSFFDTGSVSNAGGGKAGGGVTHWTGGLGGTAIGTGVSGCKGGDASGNDPGGGGGGTPSSSVACSAGGNASSSAPGSGGSGYGAGGSGGTSSGNGTAGSAPGGGGGGGGKNKTGGSGAAGRVVLTYGIPLTAEYRFDETSWNGTAGEVLDSSGTGYNASRGGTATKASSSPAYSSGGLSTCGYGRFDISGSPNAYVQLPASFPSLNSNFSITAWVRTTNINKIGQRVFVRDDNDNGWALSVSDEVAGTLRLFNRNIAFQSASLTGGGALRAGNVALDTPVVIANNNWYFVAVSVNITSKTVTLYVYNSSGTQIAETSASYTGTWGAGTGATSIGNETSVSSENSLYFSGNIDEVRVFGAALSQPAIESYTTMVRPCGGLNHIAIEHGSGSGVTCAPSTLTLKACTDANCTSLYAGGVIGTMTSTGTPTTNLVGGSTFSIGASGTGSIDVQVTTPGTVVFGANASAPTTTNATTCNFGTPSCTFTAADAGLLFDVPNHVSDTPQTVNVSAVKKADNSLSCVPAFASTSKTVSFACGYANPTTGTKQLQVGATSLTCGNNGAAGTSQGASLAFNASGVASTTIRYADVGQINLTASYTGTSGSESGLVMTGTDTFIAAPASFGVAATGPTPYVAGVSFGATVTAKNASGNATPNFGKETTPESATLSFTRCQPTGTGTSAGSFSGTLGTFSNGSASASNLNWSEVGNGDLSATLTSGSYLVSSLTATGNTGTSGIVCNGAGNIGAFRLHHFDTMVTPGCGSFTYAAQPFSVQVTAKNGLATPGITANYAGTTWAKTVTLTDANGTAGSWTSNSIAPASFVSGIASKTPSFSFTAQPAAPATLKLRATDTDGVTSAGGTEGTTDARFGRLRLSNAFGSEKANLSLPLQAQYWSGSSWVINGADSCTSLPASAFALSGTLAASTSAAAVTLAGGNGVLLLTKPNPVATGSVDVAANLGTSGVDQSCLATHGGTASSRYWLRSRNGSCAATYDRDPSARATFGIYAPETRKTVHVRELF